MSAEFDSTYTIAANCNGVSVPGAIGTIASDGIDVFATDGSHRMALT